MYERALKGKEKVWGQEHTSTLDTVDNLGLLYAKQGRLQEAETMYEQALGGYETTFRATSTLTHIPALETLENLGRLFEKKEDINAALPHYQRALAGTEAVWGQDSERYTRLSTKLNSLQCDTGEVSSEESSQN